MSVSNSLGFGLPRLTLRAPPGHEYIIRQQPLRRVLAFARISIHDVCNSPHAKRKALVHFKLYKQIERSMEITDLERQWNRG